MRRALIGGQMLALAPSTAAFLAALFPGLVALAASTRSLVTGDGGALGGVLLLTLLVLGGATGLAALWFFLLRSWQGRSIGSRGRVLLVAAALGVGANVCWLLLGPTPPDLLTAYVFWAPLLIGIPNLVLVLVRGKVAPRAARRRGAPSS